MSPKSPRTFTRREMLRLMGTGAAGAVLASCVAPTPQTVEKVVTQVVTAAPPPPPKLSEQSGVLWGLQYDPHVECYNRLAALFKKNTGATVKVAPQAWPIETKLIAALSAGNQPDVICIMGKQCLPLYLQNAMMPVEDLYKEMGVKPEDYCKDGIESVSWKGHLYGVCMELGAIGYPVNVPVEDVKKAGLQDKYPPTNGKFWFESFESMWELAKALQITDKDGKVVRWGLSSKGWDSGNYLMILRSLLLPKGSDWWDLPKTKFMVDTEEGVEAMKLFAETPVKMGIETELDQSHVDACLAGKVAIGRGNGTPAIQISEKLGYHFELAGSPLLNGQVMVGVSEAGWGFQAPRLTKHPDISREWIKMMLSDEGAIEYAKIYGGIPTTKLKFMGKHDWFQDPDPNKPLNKYFTVLETYVAPVVRYYGEQFGYAAEIDKSVPIVSSKIRLGKATSAEACKELQGLFEAQYKQYLDDVKKYEIA